MIWSCDECREWGISETAVDLVVDRQRHLDTHREQLLAPEEAEPEDTVLESKYVAWGIALLLGLLSAKWEALAVVVPFVALIAWVLTYREGGK